MRNDAGKKGPFKKKAPFKRAGSKDTFRKNRPLKHERIKPETPISDTPKPVDDGSTMRLNKYLAHCGVAARRKADEIIAAGEVKVNNTVVREMGYRIIPGKDKVVYKGKLMKPVETQVYILLNKPKDFITTVSDERDRRTVMDLVKSATTERVFPVGRLDRSTTGVLLITNDGELMQKLTHPSRKVKKIYHATLDRALEVEDMERIAAGIKLEEGLAAVDAIAYAHDSDKRQIGIEIHIGWNHVIKRIFEAAGYKVEKLDRVLFAGLTKKNVPRGKWRLLDAKEIAQLKGKESKDKVVPEPTSRKDNPKNR